MRVLFTLVFACIATAACASSGATAGDGATDRMRGAADSAVRATSDAFSRASSALETPEDSVVADPFEPFNRAMYNVNDSIDRAALGPVAHAYEAYVPLFGRRRVRDFIDNWKSPVWLANDILQGDFDHAGVTASRFGLNTTVGVLGVYDFAAGHAQLPKRDEDFGQTLGVHGVGNGAYLMLPIFGPTTFRDLTGTVVDVMIDPFSWAQFRGDSTYWVSSRVVDLVDIRAQTEPAIQAVRESIDPYAQARALYIQNRAERVRNGVGSYENLPDFE